MSLQGKKLQVIDTMDLQCIIKGKDENGNAVTRTIFTGETTKSSLDQKSEKVEVFSGVGQNKTFSLRTKKSQTLEANIASFDVDFLAYKNGVELDKTSKDTYYLAQPTAVTEKAAAIADAKRVLNVRTMDGKDIAIVQAEPKAAGEVKVDYASGAKLQFHSTFAEEKVLVTYTGATAKDNLTIVFSGKAFPKSCEILANTVVYDEESHEIAADLYVNLYKAVIDPDFTLSLEMGKAAETPVKFEVLAPQTLPDGTYNANKELGKMVITER